ASRSRGVRGRHARVRGRAATGARKAQRGGRAMTEPSPLDAQRQRFYAELEAKQMRPLWALLGRARPAQPPRREFPHRWPWRDVRPQLLKAGALVTTAEAERRVLMFLNPGN